MSDRMRNRHSQSRIEAGEPLVRNALCPACRQPIHPQRLAAHRACWESVPVKTPAELAKEALRRGVPR